MSDVKRLHFDFDGELEECFEGTECSSDHYYSASDYDALRQQLANQGGGLADWCKQEREAGNGPCGACAICCTELRQQLEQAQGESKARLSALEFAHAAISDAIYLDDGLDVETGQRVKKIIVEAMEHGTFDDATKPDDFLTCTERHSEQRAEQAEAQLAAAEARVKWLDEGVELLKVEAHPNDRNNRAYETWLAAEPRKDG